MPKDIEDVLKELNKNHKDISQLYIKANKEISGIGKEIDTLKKEMKGLSSKIDIILEMMMTITLYLEDTAEIGELEDADEDYESNEGWVTDNEEWRASLEEDDDNLED